MGEYIVVDGMKFYTQQNEGKMLEQAKKAEIFQLDKKKNPNFTFPIKTIIRKRKDGYYMFCNDTCGNYNYWEEHNKLPITLDRGYKDGRK